MESSAQESRVLEPRASESGTYDSMALDSKGWSRAQESRAVGSKGPVVLGP